MTAKKIKRKLTTIFCADVQSYSSMMATDEADTLGRLQRYRGIMSDLFERHEGRKVNTWGDAVIAEFSSVVEAVRCGVEIQDAIGAENSDLPKARQMWFRIGINLGDVMEDGTDLYGDGVNVAARLESLAEAGGIMVSETVYNLTNRHLAFGYDFAGEQMVKGLDTPIAGYRVRMPGRNADAQAAKGPASETRGSASSGTTPSPDAGNRGDLGFLDRWGDRITRFRAWYALQPKKTRIPVAAIGIMAGVNLLTTGLSNIWFIYPSIPLAAYLLFQRLTARDRRA
jgi:adenylate cyclase